MASNTSKLSTTLTPNFDLFSLVTYNLGGLNQGSTMLSHICEKINPDVIFVQEHWQNTQNLSKILNFSSCYVGYGISAMDSSNKEKILVGRPYGGTAILLKRNLSTFAELLFNSDRVVIIRLYNYIIINVYLPYKSSTSLAISDSILSELSGILSLYPDHHLIFGGDLNCSIHDKTPDAISLQNFMTNHDLICNDYNLTSRNIFTYNHATLNHHSYVDFVATAKYLNNFLLNYDIVDTEVNLSDHTPVILRFKADSGRLIPLISDPNDEPKNPISAQPRLRWDHSDLNVYRSKCLDSLTPLFNIINSKYADLISTKQKVSNIHLPQKTSSLTLGIVETSVTVGSAKYLINEWYTELTNCLVQNAILTIKSSKPQRLKHWWNRNAEILKQNALDSYRIWSLNNKPQTGALYEDMKQQKRIYKLYLIKLKNESKNKISDELYSNLIKKSSKSFWAAWNNLEGGKKKNPLKSVNGVSNGEEIANLLAEKFSQNCSPNSISHRNKHKNLLHEKLSKMNADSSSDELTDCSQIFNIVNKLKKNKSPDINKLTVEHIVFAPPLVLDIISKLINLMFRFEFVPDMFGQSLTFALPKGCKNKLNTTAEDYRGISISPLISKIYEHCLLDRFKKFLTSSPLQFGFKNKIGCAHALYTVQSTVDYFTEGKSNVYLCSLDLVKAFDKVDRYTLFHKLLRRNCPVKFVNILEEWFSKTFTSVKWQGHVSKPVPLKAGLRQGSILSPILFAVYVNDMLEKLNNSKLGCHIKYMPFNALMYADDLILCSISIRDLQSMINLVLHELKELDMTINVKKSCCMKVGPTYKKAAKDLIIGSDLLGWSDSIKYLGLTFISSTKLKCDFHHAKSQFFSSINGILSHIGSRTDLRVSLHLLFSKCVPILMYGLEAIILNSSQASNLSFVYNAIFVKLFNSFDKVIIANCQFYSGYLSFKYFVDVKKINFFQSLCHTISNSNSPATFLFNWFDQQCYDNLLNNYELPRNANKHLCSQHIWRRFEKSLNI